MSIIQCGKAVYRNLKYNQLLRMRTELTDEQAESILQAFLPRSKPSFCQENQIDPQFDVMIIIPVYNVESYLEQCIDSILNQQTSYTYQAVFVDDGSTDGSGAILDRMIHAPHKVIHKKNGGLSSARNCALKTITGRYVLFLDSDDYLELNAIQALVSAADEKNADITEGGHAVFCAQNIVEQNMHSEELTYIPYRELYGFAWNKLICSTLLESFCFPEEYLFEDTVMSALLHPACTCAVSVPSISYYYRDNQAGITHSSRTKPAAVDTFWMMRFYLEERISRGQLLEQADYIRYLTAIRRNWCRTEKLPAQVQESLFVLSCDLFERCLPFCYEGSEHRMVLLEQAIQNRSYEAYRFLMERWDIL